MRGTKFIEFDCPNSGVYSCTKLNEWLKKTPNANIVHWTAIPIYESGVKILIEYIEESAPKSKTKKNNDLNNVKKMTKQVELELEDSLY